jgi:AbrB family looped-hinge helix DNA binding protein
MAMERPRRVVKVTRRGQTTIPIEFRRRHAIDEGSRLVIEDRGDSMVIRPVPKLEDLGGSLSKKTTLESLLKALEESREAGD